MRVERIVVGRGKSVLIGGPEGEWLKTFYQVEAVLDQGDDPKATRLSLERMLDKWLSGEKAEAEAVIPHLDLAELEDLPWISYQTKQPAGEGEAGWIFSNTQGAEELAKAVERGSGKLELGPYAYRFSGKERQFITRRPVKK